MTATQGHAPIQCGALSIHLNAIPQQAARMHEDRREKIIRAICTAVRRVISRSLSEASNAPKDLIAASPDLMRIGLGHSECISVANGDLVYVLIHQDLHFDFFDNNPDDDDPTSPTPPPGSPRPPSTTPSEFVRSVDRTLKQDLTRDGRVLNEIEIVPLMSCSSILRATSLREAIAFGIPAFLLGELFLLRIASSSRRYAREDFAKRFEAIGNDIRDQRGYLDATVAYAREPMPISRNLAGVIQSRLLDRFNIEGATGLYVTLDRRLLNLSERRLAILQVIDKARDELWPLPVRRMLFLLDLSYGKSVVADTIKRQHLNLRSLGYLAERFAAAYEQGHNDIRRQRNYAGAMNRTAKFDPQTYAEPDISARDLAGLSSAAGKHASGTDCSTRGRLSLNRTVDAAIAQSACNDGICTSDDVSGGIDGLLTSYGSRDVMTIDSHHRISAIGSLLRADEPIALEKSCRVVAPRETKDGTLFIDVEHHGCSQMAPAIILEHTRDAPRARLTCGRLADPDTRHMDEDDTLLEGRMAFAAIAAKAERSIWLMRDRSMMHLAKNDADFLLLPSK